MANLQTLLSAFEKSFKTLGSKFAGIGRVQPEKGVLNFSFEGQRYEASYTSKKVTFVLISKYGRSVKYGTPTEYVLGSITRHAITVRGNKKGGEKSPPFHH